MNNEDHIGAVVLWRFGSEPTAEPNCIAIEHLNCALRQRTVRRTTLAGDRVKCDAVSKRDRDDHFNPKEGTMSTVLIDGEEHHYSTTKEDGRVKFVYLGVGKVAADLAKLYDLIRPPEPFRLTPKQRRVLKKFNQEMARRRAMPSQKRAGSPRSTD